jgi:hypothetical protein
MKILDWLFRRNKMSYNDGSEVLVNAEEEDPPKSGVWVDSEDLITDPTDDELNAGEFLGQAIDVDDDEDDGSKWGTIDEPALTGEDMKALSAPAPEPPKRGRRKR